MAEPLPECECDRARWGDAIRAGVKCFFAWQEVWVSRSHVLGSRCQGASPYSRVTHGNIH